MGRDDDEGRKQSLKSIQNNAPQTVRWQTFFIWVIHHASLLFSVFGHTLMTAQGFDQFSI